MEIKCQLDATEVLIADLIACSTSILQTGRITLSSTPDQLLEKPQHEISQAATTVTGRITLSSTPDQLLEKPQHEIPQAATTLELLMIGIVMTETC